jgi:NADPH:quinone reductase-like Zn-dependent oxidoreductase
MFMIPTRLRAIGLDRYGPLESLHPITLPLPEPGRGELRVRVHASALNPADFKVCTGEVKLLHARNFPMVLGYDYSGVVELVGPGTTDFAVGDAVFGFLPYSPFNRRGAFAEVLIASAAETARKPEGISHLQAAAATTPALTALQMLRDLGRLPAQGGRALVTGVSGGVGSAAVAIAKRLGATVTGVGSGRGLELARSLGADAVIDRKRQDVLTEAVGPFDVVLDAAAASRWKSWKAKLAPGGAFVTTLPSVGFMLDKLASLVSSTRTAFVTVKSRPADLRQIGEWLAAGLVLPIDSTIPVRDVPKGLARLLQGDVLGRIVVDVANGF